MRPIIKVENLSKQYRIGTRQAAYATLRESVTNAVSAPFRRIKSLTNGNGGNPQSAIGNRQSNLIWALKDVSFEVMPGEVVGIIGRNGAGKSTLLKILSRVTEPTTGEVEIHGRVGSLLEVGTGFHPELTGRENTYLNGAILGMKKSEINRKFDEIVAFAEIEKFIDTPVKHYSTGMYMRLAFSVAAHLEPEVLLVDEVLAVGDATFQRKCLGRMDDIAKTGRTVLLISHNMGAIVSLCDRCLLIEKGALIQNGPPSQVAARYQSMLYSTLEEASDLSSSERRGTGKARFTSIRLVPIGPDGSHEPVLRTGQDMRVDLNIVASSDIDDLNVALIVYDSSGYRLIDANTALKGSFLSLKLGEGAQVRLHLRNVLLKPGRYLLGLWMGRGGIEDVDSVPFATSFSVEADAHTLMHTETFPGAYQCLYTHTIQTNGFAGKD